MYRPGLAAQDHPVHPGELGQRGQGDRPHLGPGALQHPRRVLQRRGRLRMRGHVGLVEMPHEADAQVAHAAVQHAAEIPRAAGRAAGIGRVVRRHRVQHQRVVRHRAGQRTDMVQREGQREHAAPRHQPVGRLQPDDPAGAGRVAHRPAGIGPQRRRKQPRRHARPGPGRRPTRMMVRVPRIARRRERQVEARPADGELMRGGLAQHDRPRLAQPSDHGGVLLGDVVEQDLGVAGGRQPGHVDDVLHPDRHAVHLYLLLIIPVLGLWYWFRYKKDNADLQISNTKSFESTGKSAKQYLYFSLYLLRILAIALLIVALARPQSSTSRKNVTIEGIDIVIALDISSSMLAMDLQPNRLEAAKEVATEFIAGRPNDRFGLVIFSGEAFTQCPLTTDHVVLNNLFKEVHSGMIEDGTAIGDGLATAINRLKDSKAVSKVIILLTDGVNNMGSVDPLSAAQIAKVFGIRIYTIGVGTEGTAPYPVQTPFGVQTQYVEVKIDEALLQKVAEMTDGKYFRATSNRKLREIYSEIDKLEKSKIDVTEFRKKKEEFFPFALLAFVFITLEVVLKNTVFKSVT